MEALRPLLITYAYNISGSLADAEDIVQDAFLQLMKVDRKKIENEKAYLIRTVINLSVNFKNRQNKRRVTYPGQWLPEPIDTEQADSRIYKKEILSYSLMVLLEKLNARQRAVFILKEAFDYTHIDIAEALGITTDYSRQLLSRARKQMETFNPVDNPDTKISNLDKYVTVIKQGDVQKLEQLLNEDIIVLSDGGGKASAGLNPVCGKKAVIAYLLGIYKKFYQNRYIEPAIINHQPALLYYVDNKLVNCQIFAYTGNHISRVFFIRNPDKLKVLEEKTVRAVTD